MLRPTKIADMRRDHLGAVRPTEEQELLDLMRGDVGQDPAVLRFAKEPGGPRGHSRSVRSQTNRLDDTSDRSAVDKFAGLDRRPAAEVLTEEDGNHTACLGPRAPERIQ